MTYGEIKAQFSSLLNRRDASDALKETFLQQAVSRIQRVLRVPALEKAVITEVAADFDGLTIPSDFLELKSITVDDGPTLRQVDLSTVRENEATIGIPYFFQRRGAKWRIAPVPEEGSEIRIDYYAETSALALDADENTLSIIAPDLIIYGALSYAGDYFTDKRAETFEGRFKQILVDLEEQAMDDELSGGAAMVPAYSYSDDM